MEIPIRPSVWLGQRERQVLILLCQAKRNKEIAGSLGVSVPAIKRDISALLIKLGVADRFELMLWCLQHPDAIRLGFTRETGLHSAGCCCNTCSGLLPQDLEAA